jgi:hypothetical protein
MKKINLTRLMALLLGISLLTNTGAANAAPPAKAKTNATKSSFFSTMGGSWWKPKKNVGSNNAAFSPKGTAKGAPNTRKTIKTGNVSPATNAKPTGQQGYVNSQVSLQTGYAKPSSGDVLAQINTKKAATANQKAAQNSANALEAALLNQQNKLNLQKQNSWTNTQKAIQESKAIQSTSPFKW